MTKPDSRQPALTPPRTAWESTLEDADGFDRFRAGEQDAGNEPGGGGDKGLDAETGDGGYGGDAVIAGHDASTVQPERPLDREIHGDPRTHVGESYPGEMKKADPRQQPPGRQHLDDDEDVDGDDEDVVDDDEDVVDDDEDVVDDDEDLIDDDEDLVDDGEGVDDDDDEDVEDSGPAEEARG